MSVLLTKDEVSLKGRISRTEIHQRDLGIDVLARAHDEETSHVLLIKDKTDADHIPGAERWVRMGA